MPSWPGLEGQAPNRVPSLPVPSSLAGEKSARLAPARREGGPRRPRPRIVAGRGGGGRGTEGWRRHGYGRGGGGGGRGKRGPRRAREGEGPAWGWVAARGVRSFVRSFVCMPCTSASPSRPALPGAATLCLPGLPRGPLRLCNPISYPAPAKAPARSASRRQDGCLLYSRAGCGSPAAAQPRWLGRHPIAVCTLKR